MTQPTECKSWPASPESVKLTKSQLRRLIIQREWWPEDIGVVINGIIYANQYQQFQEELGVYS